MIGKNACLQGVHGDVRRGTGFCVDICSMYAAERNQFLMVFGRGAEWDIIEGLRTGSECMSV